jgi:hypothetical protein
MLSGCLNPDSITLKEFAPAEQLFSSEHEQTADAATAAINGKK